MEPYEVVTIVNILLAAQGYLEAARETALERGASREFSIAITAVEDAIMRTNRGFARQKGVFTIADVEGTDG
jgi:hypothetical protein